MNKILKKYKELSKIVNYIRYMIELEEMNNSLCNVSGRGRSLVLKKQ